jgi:ribonuclease HI
MEIYTDGGCIQNPGGIGAWAFVVVLGGTAIHRDSGAHPETTNNRMEMMAVIRAMEWLGQRAAVIKTDSLLTVKCANGSWKRKANTDLWADLFGARKPGHKIEWVKGHNGNVWNEMADKMCSEEMRSLRRNLRTKTRQRLPDCGCADVAPWEDCRHAFASLDQEQVQHLRSILTAG